ncbi:MAG: ATP-binding cassette domain-containing protein, partial [Alphaproteobacteria bacterium]
MTLPKPLFHAEGLVRHFGAASVSPFQTPRGAIRAVDGVSLTVASGETLALVGESGCGKSTLARLIVRLDRPDAGQITFDGMDVTSLDGTGLRSYRRRVQMVFQDPYLSLNPRETVGQAIINAWEINEDVVPRAERRAKAADRHLEPRRAERGRR